MNNWWRLTCDQAWLCRVCLQWHTWTSQSEFPQTFWPSLHPTCWSAGQVWRAQGREFRDIVAWHMPTRCHQQTELAVAHLAKLATSVIEFTALITPGWKNDTMNITLTKRKRNTLELFKYKTYYYKQCRDLYAVSSDRTHRATVSPSANGKTAWSFHYYSCTTRQHLWLSPACHRFSHSTQWRSVTAPSKSMRTWTMVCTLKTKFKTSQSKNETDELCQNSNFRNLFKNPSISK